MKNFSENHINYYVPEHITNKNTKLNVKHFEKKNRNILKYLLFGFRLEHFLVEKKLKENNEEMSFKNLKLNPKIIYDFLNNLNNKELQIIKLERDKSTYKNKSEKERLHHIIFWFVFYEKNRKEYNTSFRFIYKPNLNKLTFNLTIDSNYDNEYYKSFMSNPVYSKEFIYLEAYNKLNMNDNGFIIDTDKQDTFNILNVINSNEYSKKLYNEFEFISNPYYKVPKTHKYIQTFYKVNGKNYLFDNILFFLEYSFINNFLSTVVCSDRFKYLYGNNPLKLNWPIERLPLIYLEGSENINKDTNKLYIKYINKKSKLSNQYEKPLFNNGLLRYIK